MTTTVKIDKLDKPAMKHLRGLIDAALVDVAKETGLVIKLGNGSFSDDNGTFKLNVNTVGENGEAVTKEMTDLKNQCMWLGLSKSCVGAKFMYGGNEYILVGLKVRATKAPFLAKKTSDGKLYKFSEEGIKSLIGKEHLNGA